MSFILPHDIIQEIGTYLTNEEFIDYFTMDQTLYKFYKNKLRDEHIFAKYIENNHRFIEICEQIEMVQIELGELYETERLFEMFSTVFKPVLADNIKKYEESLALLIKQREDIWEKYEFLNFL